jgi:5-methylcytosine-specific restriction endonuclease McrA
MRVDREKVHVKYGGYCAYCGKMITLKGMQVDHINPKWNGGTDAEDNLNPSCRSCNHYKREKNLEQYREYMKTLHERVSAIYISKVALDYGVIRIKPFDGLFHFEKLEA